VPATALQCRTGSTKSVEPHDATERILRQLEIDWNALHSAFQMNMPEVKCFLSLDDGTVLKLPPGDTKLAEVRAEPTRFAPIDAIPSRIQYQWLDEFIKSMEDDSLRGRMEAAINGKGAFRRFKDILLTLPDERRRWFEFRDIMMRKRIVDWVREQGIDPANEPAWTATEDGMPIEVKPANTQHDIEDLRDFLIDWVGKRGADALTPLALEQLASAISESFKIKPNPR
jgi:hypothetical protein